MHATYPDNLSCPIDATVLTLQNRQLRCTHGHHFDIARQGYVNLLPVQHKKSKQPGDNKTMVMARTHFLNTRVYQPIADAVTKTLSGLLADTHQHYCVLDAGCGDGYYLDQLLQALPHHRISGIGVDISKQAVMAAAKRNPHLTWLVASNKQLPVLPHSVDVILSVFGFPSVQGFAQALGEQGKVVVVEPGAQHLIELRTMLYKEVEESPGNNAWLSSSAFCEESTQTLTYLTQPLANDELVNLLNMTPHFYRAPKETVEAVCKQTNLRVTVDVKIMVCARVK